jgi:hypothetical protein
MRRIIPDLRVEHNEFTLEHCSVLLVKLGAQLDLIYGGGMMEIADQADPERMRDDLLSLMSANQLSILFDSEIGKGLIIGAFYAKFVLPQEEVEE